MDNLTPKEKEFAILALELRRTEDIAKRAHVSRAQGFRYLRKLLGLHVLQIGPADRYIEGEAWGRYVHRIDNTWIQSHGVSLARASETETGPRPPLPRLATHPRFEHGGQVFYFQAPLPPEFLAGFRPLARNKRGEAVSWVRYERDDELGLAEFYVGNKGGASATLHLGKRPMQPRALMQDGEVDRQIEETFQIWKRRIEAKFSLRMTPRGVPIPDGKTKEAREPYRTGESEWTIEGLGDIKKERVGESVGIDGSPDENGIRVASVATADQAKARELAKFAVGGGFEAIMNVLKTLADSQTRTAEAIGRLTEGQEKSATSMQMLAESIALQASQGPGPQPGGKASPGRRDT